MKTLFTAAIAAAFLMAGQAWADNAASKDAKKPVQLTAAQMDGVTAGFVVRPPRPQGGAILIADPVTGLLGNGKAFNPNAQLWRGHFSSQSGILSTF